MTDHREPKEGEYFYRPHRKGWGVWKAGKVVNGIGGNEFISDFSTQIQARNFVYRMNGWEIKKIT